jgi:hypothetical protein
VVVVCPGRLRATLVSVTRTRRAGFARVAIDEHHARDPRGADRRARRIASRLLSDKRGGRHHDRGDDDGARRHGIALTAQVEGLHESPAASPLEANSLG